MDLHLLMLRLVYETSLEWNIQWQEWIEFSQCSTHATLVWELEMIFLWELPIEFQCSKGMCPFYEFYFYGYPPPQ
jgi:hypothetical protein